MSDDHIDPDKGKPVDYEKLELWQRQQNWKLAFFLLLAAVVVFILWYMRGMPDDEH